MNSALLKRTRLLDADQHEDSEEHQYEDGAHQFEILRHIEVVHGTDARDYARGHVRKDRQAATRRLTFSWSPN